MDLKQGECWFVLQANAISIPVPCPSFNSSLFLSSIDSFLLYFFITSPRASNPCLHQQLTRLLNHPINKQTNKPTNQQTNKPQQQQQHNAFCRRLFISIPSLPWSSSQGSSPSAAQISSPDDLTTRRRASSQDSYVYDMGENTTNAYHDSFGLPL